MRDTYMCSKLGWVLKLKCIIYENLFEQKKIKLLNKWILWKVKRLFSMS